MVTTGPNSDQQDPIRERLQAILAADAVGYSRLMSLDGRATLAALDTSRCVFRAEVEKRGGRVVDMAGDSVLAVFDSASAAVDAAVAAQLALLALAAAVPEQRRMLFRIGVHLGEIIEKSDGTVYGDGVNIAARLQALAPAAGVAVSEVVQTMVVAHSPLQFVDCGQHHVKNIERPVRVFLVDHEGKLAIQALHLPETGPARLGNLPVQSTSLIGRGPAVTEVIALLDSNRLVTLLGLGGFGKTRLSIEIATQASKHFPDGTWFVDLAAVSDPAAVALAAAGVFGVTQQSGKTIEQSLADSLGSRCLLIILDNAEHLSDAPAALAHKILSACPRVKIIATSRHALSISGEKIWPVPPLRVEGDVAPAVELFIERARAGVPDFDPTPHLQAISRICSELEGIPLAIELAAARVRSLSPAQILERLSERFRLLTGGSRAPERLRHQTLRNAVQWSFDLLSNSERAVMIRSAAFAGGFTLEGAERVCTGREVDSIDVYDVLDSLVSKSLLYVERKNGAVRFAMLETIRSFGAEKLTEAGEVDAVRRRHAEFFAQQSGEYFDIWRSRREREAYEWLDLEINNLRVAFRWSLEHGDVDSAARIASDVGDMGRFRLREEAANWAEEIVAAARVARHPRLVVLLTWCASTAWAFSRFDDARRFGEEAIALLDDPSYDPFIWAYGDLAFVAIFSGDIPRAIDLLRIGSEHPADRRDRFIMAFHLYIMATAGYADQAAAIADEVLRQVDAAGVPMAIAVAYGAKGAAIEAKDPAAALAAYEHGVEVARASGSRFMETLIAPRIAALHARSGDPRVALQGFQRMLESFGNATDIASVSAWRASLVVLLTKLGQFEAAATLHGTFAASIDASGVVPELPAAVTTLRSALGEAGFKQAAERGTAMSLREATNYAIQQISAMRLNLVEEAAAA